SRRAAIAAVGGYDETVMRGQTEELAMRLNLAGWKALATKRVVFRHFHAERHWRPNKADTGEGLARSLERFREKWGVDRLAPDLAEVWRRYAGTPLVERARLSAPRRWNPAETGDLAPGGEWERFASDPATQASIAQELAMLRVADGPTAVLGCRSGLAAFLRAREGTDVAAFEEHAPSIDAANAFIARATKPCGSLQLSTVENLSSTSGASGAFRVVSLLDTLERTWNPIGLLGESRRLLAANGLRESPRTGERV
ncbi:MAG: hypothetical protein LW806_10620, partial [Planctomycetaceae bacterium]|nr:hypothetical protein [Planctomycetaceae bacterium]